MFYPVIIKAANGEIRKTISSKELSERHWEDFNVSDVGAGKNSSTRKLRKEVARVCPKIQIN